MLNAVMKLKASAKAARNARKRAGQARWEEPGGSYCCFPVCFLWVPGGVPRHPPGRSPCCTRSTRSTCSTSSIHSVRSAQLLRPSDPCSTLIHPSNPSDPSDPAVPSGLSAPLSRSIRPSVRSVRSIRVARSVRAIPSIHPVHPVDRYIVVHRLPHAPSVRSVQRTDPSF